MTLKELRIRAGFTQEYVAKKLNVTQGAVCKWETGESRPLKKYWEELAKLYECTPEDIRSQPAPAEG